MFAGDAELAGAYQTDLLSADGLRQQLQVHFESLQLAERLSTNWGEISEKFLRICPFSLRQPKEVTQTTQSHEGYETDAEMLPLMYLVMLVFPSFGGILQAEMLRLRTMLSLMMAVTGQSFFGAHLRGETRGT